jgi:hypothetical protein
VHEPGVLLLQHPVQDRELEGEPRREAAVGVQAQE